MSLKEKINPERLPVHIAIIMDGNGRWAQQRGKDRIYGHQKGVDAVREIIEGAAGLGIKYITLYAFSTENWNRPWTEVEALMELMVHSLSTETERLVKNNIRLHIIGDIDRLSPVVRKSLDDTLAITADCTGMNLVVGLSYSSRWEIINAIKSISREVESGKIKPGDIDDKMLEKHLTTREIPDPEILVRTSGELRISNFLLWQIAYSELYFTETLWPDFGKEELYKAIIDYQRRERRFGKTSEQVHEK
ncbi:MAG: isoprenyl transferase [Marinilabiliaceae bacterium]|jgi:undecaprenyl diphosphate synthase|nr:isoprenyl transferase [Marinilabiliaceae bacterium]